MNHLTAAQLVGGGWHYVNMNRRTGTYPLGYCSDHPGHLTEAEARECYAAYQRSMVRLDAKFADWTGCEVEGCDKPTKTAARILNDGYHTASLCDEHLTTEHAIKALHLDGPAGDSWQS